MKIGQTFKYRKSGNHQDYTIVLLHDYETNERFLYNMDWKARTGDWIALYGKPDRVLTKSEVKEVYKEFCQKYKKT